MNKGSIPKYSKDSYNSTFKKKSLNWKMGRASVQIFFQRRHTDSQWAHEEMFNSINHQFSSVQFNSVTQSCPTLWDSMNYSMPGLPVHHQLLEFTQTHVHWVSNAIQASHPLLAPSLPTSVFPSIRVFSNKSTLRMRWPKYWSFSFSISPSKEHPGLISFRMDWMDILAVQGTLKSLLQYHS